MKTERVLFRATAEFIVHTVRWFSRPWRKITATAENTAHDQNHGKSHGSREYAIISRGPYVISFLLFVKIDFSLNLA